MRAVTGQRFYVEPMLKLAARSRSTWVSTEIDFMILIGGGCQNSGKGDHKINTLIHIFFHIYFFTFQVAENLYIDLVLKGKMAALKSS